MVKQQQEETFYCIGCKTNHKKKNFYISYNPLHNGVLPFCKNFIKKEVYINNQINLDKLKNILMQMDVPFLIDYWEKSVEDEKETIGTYFKNISLKQTRGLKWKNSQFEKKIINNEIYDENINESQIIDNIIVSSKKNRFVVTEEIIDKWGIGYDIEEYQQFEKKYQKLIIHYGEKTSLHTEALITYIRYRVKEEMATAKGLATEAKNWGALAKDAATAARINVSQLSKSDISGGIDVISQLIEAIESEVGIIPLLPKLLEQPYDDADMIIWSNINYLRRLEEKPMVSYREIWKFYDEMLGEYYKQKGYDEIQIEEYKAKRNNVFRDLGEVYVEPLYQEEVNGDTELIDEVDIQ